MDIHPDVFDIFARNIRVRRAARNWTQTELSTHAECGVKTVYLAESGKGLSTRSQAKLALAFEVGIEELWRPLQL